MKQGKCSYCKTKTDKPIVVGLRKFCSYDCAAKLGLEKSEKKKRKENKERLQDLQPASYWVKKAQVAVNKYIRIRDANKPCISCERFHEGQYHAGHYKSTGAHPELRFNIKNIYKQCAPCNNHLSGNIVNYRISLISIYGEELVNYLESNHPSRRYSIEYLKRIAKVFNAKSRLYERKFRK